MYHLHYLVTIPGKVIEPPPRKVKKNKDLKIFLFLHIKKFISKLKVVIERLPPLPPKPPTVSLICKHIPMCQ